MSAPKCTPTPSDRQTALSRAKLARFIAALFSDPALVGIRKLSGPALKAELNEAAAGVGIDTCRLDAVLGRIETDTSIETACDRVLGHTVRSQCPPYELEYRSSEVFQQSQTLADIAGFYRAFGFDAAGPVMERADHAAAEWEFLAALAMKEALAPGKEDADCCKSAQRDFLTEHAAVWMPAFFERLRRADADGLFAAAADLADAVLRNWCEDHGVACGPKWMELRPVSDEDSEITCGAAGTVELGPALASAMQDRE